MAILSSRFGCQNSTLRSGSADEVSPGIFFAICRVLQSALQSGFVAECVIECIDYNHYTVLVYGEW